MGRPHSPPLHHTLTWCPQGLCGVVVGAFKYMPFLGLGKGPPLATLMCMAHSCLHTCSSPLVAPHGTWCDLTSPLPSSHPTHTPPSHPPGHHPHHPRAWRWPRGWCGSPHGLGALGPAPSALPLVPGHVGAELLVQPDRPTLHPLWRGLQAAKPGGTRVGGHPMDPLRLPKAPPPTPTPSLGPYPPLGVKILVPEAWDPTETPPTLGCLQSPCLGEHGPILTSMHRDLVARCQLHNYVPTMPAQPHSYVTPWYKGPIKPGVGVHNPLASSSCCP